MDYLNNFDGVVRRMMQRFPGTAVITIVGDGVYDENTGQYTTTDINYTVNCIVLDYTLQSNGTQTDRGTLIQAGDKQVYVQPTEKSSNGAVLMPKIQPQKDYITIANVKYGIVTFKEFNPSQSNNYLIELYIRK